MSKRYYVYMTQNKYNNVLYIGVSGNLGERVFDHKNKIDKKSFTAKYNCDKLVYFEIYDDVNLAITREKKMKKWHRKWKDELIDSMNPERKDLWEEVCMWGD